jgi:hypothetical protein
MYTAFAFLGFEQLQVRGWFPWWLAVLLGALAIAAIIVLYIKESGRLGVPTRVALATVRTATVVVVAFLLLRPVWANEKKGEKARPVAILIDVSQSMANADPRPNTADLGRAAIALGFTDVDKGLPDASVITSLGEKLQTPPQRIQVARSMLTLPKLNFFSRLAKLGPLQVFTFGSTRTGRDPEKTDWLKNLEATEPHTAMVQAAFEMISREDSEAPAAIVLVTDGRENVGPRSLDDLARECARRKIPIYVYGVGSSSYGQLQAAFGSAATDKNTVARVGSDIDVPNTLFVDDVAAIPVRYTVKGLSEGTANIVLKYGDREVATKKETFSLTDEEKRTGKTFSTVLKFVPTKLDAESRKQDYTVSIDVTSGNGFAADKVSYEISRPAQVVNRKLKVLVVDSVPRRDFQFLQRSLLRDRRVEAKFYLTDGDKQAMRSGPPWMIDFSREVNGVLNLDREEFYKILFDFDLLILGDVPGKFFTDEHQDVIGQFVKNGGGLIHIAGRWHAPADWVEVKARMDAENQRIEEQNKRRSPNDQLPKKECVPYTLPVEFEAVRFPIQAVANPVGFVPVLAPAASRTQIVSLEDDPLDNAELWGKLGPPPAIPSEKLLKPLYWYYPVTKVKPAADVFLTHPTDRTPKPDDKPMPLLAGHYYGQGYVLWVGFDDTWRWRFNTQEKLFGRFWTQAVYTAGVPRIVGTRQTQISTNTHAPVKGESGEVYLRVFNENFQPFAAEELDAKLERLDASTNDKDRETIVKFHKVPGVNGEYVATIPYNQTGQFRLSVDPKNRNPATLNYSVNYPENHEQSPGMLDEAAMRQLAETTGGKFYREEDLMKLPDEVRPQPSPFYQREEILLWNAWIMGALIALLTLEWFLRKFNGLS